MFSQRISDLMKDGGDCRAAPGFARVCLIYIVRNNSLYRNEREEQLMDRLQKKIIKT